MEKDWQTTCLDPSIIFTFRGYVLAGKDVRMGMRALQTIGSLGLVGHVPAIREVQALGAIPRKGRSTVPLSHTMTAFNLLCFCWGTKRTVMLATEEVPRVRTQGLVDSPVAPTHGSTSMLCTVLRVLLSRRPLHLVLVISEAAAWPTATAMTAKTT